MVTICISKFVNFYFMPSENSQDNSIDLCTRENNIETYDAHLASQIVQKSVVTAPGINIKMEEVKQTGSLSSPAFGNPIAINIEVKREANDQGILTFLYKILSPYFLQLGKISNLKKGFLSH